MRRMIRIVLVIFFISIILYIGYNVLSKNKNTNAISNTEYKPTLVKNWRINDINTYEYIFSEIINQFNDGVLDKDLWITENFRKNYSIDNYGIYLSSIGVPNEEWYRLDEETGSINAFNDNTQEMLDNGYIIFYTTKWENGKLSSENKYTFKFEVDKKGKLNKLFMQNKSIIKDYVMEMNMYNNMFLNLTSDIFVHHLNDYSKYDNFFSNNIDYVSEIKNILNKYPNLNRINLRVSTSTNERSVFYAQVNDANNTKIGFAIVYSLHFDKINSIRSNWLIEIDDEMYNSEDILEEIIY